MILGRVYDSDNYNCVDFAFELLRENNMPTPDIDVCKTVPGFFRALRKHWSPAEWPPVNFDLVVMVSCGQWHIGVWKDGRVWHCSEQSQATDLGTIKSCYSRVEFYRHV